MYGHLPLRSYFLRNLLYSNALYLVVCRNLTQSRHETPAVRVIDAGRVMRMVLRCDGVNYTSTVLALRHHGVNYTSGVLFLYENRFSCDFARHFYGAVPYLSVSIPINRRLPKFDAEFCII